MSQPWPWARFGCPGLPQGLPAIKTHQRLLECPHGPGPRFPLICDVWSGPPPQRGTLFPGVMPLMVALLAAVISERGILATKEHWLGLDLLKRDCGLSGGGWRMSNPLKGHRSAYVMALHVLAYDLTRVINIMGTNARSRVSRPNPRPQRPEPELVRVNL